MIGEESYIVEAIASAYGAASEFAFSLENVARELAKANPRAATRMRDRTSRVMAGLVEELAALDDLARGHEYGEVTLATVVLPARQLAARLEQHTEHLAAHLSAEQAVQ